MWAHENEKPCFPAGECQGRLNRNGEISFYVANDMEKDRSKGGS